jgi:hypothetical protein
MIDNVVKDTLHNSLDAGTISGTKVVLCKVKKGDHVWIQTSNAYATNYFHVKLAAFISSGKSLNLEQIRIYPLSCSHHMI